MFKITEKWTSGMVILLIFLALVYSISSSNIITSTIYWFSPSGGTPPIIVGMNATSDLTGIISNSTNPTNNNSYIRFLVQHYDPDSDYHTTYICKTNNFSNSTGCLDGQWCSYTPADVVNPQTCNYIITPTETASVYDFWACVLDTGMQYSCNYSTFSVNHPPEMVSINVTPSIAYVTNTLTCNAVGSDPDNNSMIFNYTWYKNDILISGQTNQTYVCLLPQCSKYNNLSCNSCVTDVHGYAGNCMTSSKVMIRNTAPSGQPYITPTSPTSSDDLTCNENMTDIDGDSLTYTYKWFKNGAIQLFTSRVLSYGSTRKGEQWACQVTAIDNEVATTVNSSNVTILNSVPTTPILNHPHNGTTVQQSIFNWKNSDDIDGDNITYQLQVANNTDFISPTVDVAGISKDNYNASLLEGTYYWRVKALDSEGNSSWSEVWEFFYVGGTCNDGIRNFHGGLWEDGVDCGGVCPPCSTFHSKMVSGSFTDAWNTHCSNGFLDTEAGETDMDCGGTGAYACPRCGLDQHCLNNSDCNDGLYCDSASNFTCEDNEVLTYCFNGKFDPTLGETDIDCGGKCSRCGIHMRCNGNSLECQEKLICDKNGRCELPAVAEKGVQIQEFTCSHGETPTLYVIPESEYYGHNNCSENSRLFTYYLGFSPTFSDEFKKYYDGIQPYVSLLVARGNLGIYARADDSEHKDILVNITNANYTRSCYAGLGTCKDSVAFNSLSTLNCVQIELCSNASHNIGLMTYSGKLLSHGVFNFVTNESSPYIPVDVKLVQDECLEPPETWVLTSDKFNAEALNCGGTSGGNTQTMYYILDFTAPLSNISLKFQQVIPHLSIEREGVVIFDGVNPYYTQLEGTSIYSTGYNALMNKVKVPLCQGVNYVFKIYSDEGVSQSYLQGDINIKAEGHGTVCTYPDAFYLYLCEDVWCYINFSKEGMSTHEGTGAGKGLQAVGLGDLLGQTGACYSVFGEQMYARDDIGILDVQRMTENFLCFIMPRFPFSNLGIDFYKPIDTLASVIFNPTSFLFNLVAWLIHTLVFQVPIWYFLTFLAINRWMRLMYGENQSFFSKTIIVVFLALFLLLTVFNWSILKFFADLMGGKV